MSEAVDEGQAGRQSGPAGPVISSVRQKEQSSVIKLKVRVEWNMIVPPAPVWFIPWLGDAEDKYYRIDDPSFRMESVAAERLTSGCFLSHRAFLTLLPRLRSYSSLKVSR